MASPRSALATKLERLRLERGWSVYKAAHELGLSEAMVRAFEGRHQNGEPEPGRVQLRTVLRFLSAYYPALDLGDFFPGTIFEVRLRT